MVNTQNAVKKSVLFVREGDFMEHRGTDRNRVAEVAEALGVAYTKDRQPNTWIVGVPVHAWEPQRSALAAAGYDVTSVPK